MKAWQLKDFGLEHLGPVELPQPEPGPHDVLVHFQAASINQRDHQIVMGQFTPNVDFPLVPLSDGAGEVVATGDSVTRLQVGDRAGTGHRWCCYRRPAVRQGPGRYRSRRAFRQTGDRLCPLSRPSIRPWYAAGRFQSNCRLD